MKIFPVFAHYSVSSLKTGDLDAIALSRHETQENIVDMLSASV